jgi:hypothetical protein
MNEKLRVFVSETNANFAERMKTPRDLFQRKVTADDFTDVAVLGGYSVADILSGQVHEGDIDPEVIRAFHLQYPNAGEFVDFVRSHAGDDDALAGIVSGIKGKLFEIEYVEWLNHSHLPAGAVAELASNPTQEGWDVVIKDSNGHVLDHLQLKATESLAYIKEALAAHPEIDVVATHEVFDQLDGSSVADHVTAADFSNGQLTEHVHEQIQAAELTPEFHLPLIAFGIIALQAYREHKRGNIGASEAVKLVFHRGWMSTVCRGAAYAATLISGDPLVGLPVAVLTRTTFSRIDVHRELMSLLDQYQQRCRDRAMRLMSRKAISEGDKL